VAHISKVNCTVAPKWLEIDQDNQVNSAWTSVCG